MADDVLSCMTSASSSKRSSVSSSRLAVCTFASILGAAESSASSVAAANTQPTVKATRLPPGRGGEGAQ